MSAGDRIDGGAECVPAALIFDFDGLVIDTESAVYAGWLKIYERFDQPLPLETYVQCVGSTRARYDPEAELDRLVGVPLDWDALHAEKDRSIRRLLRKEDTLPGIRDLLAEARERGVPCAIASSSPHAWVEPWLEQLGLTLFFAAVCCRDDVPLPKPAPDLFLLAARRLGVAPADAIVLEDSANGLVAAAAAGCPCVVVPNPVTSRSNFAGAAAVFDSLGGIRLSDLAAHGTPARSSG